MEVRLSPRAESQLAALPRPAARRVVEALRLLGGAPRSGRPYPPDSELRGLFYKVIVVKLRRWSYRITYEIRGEAIVVYFLHPSWYPATHLDLARASLPNDD